MNRRPGGEGGPHSPGDPADDFVPEEKSRRPKGEEHQSRGGGVDLVIGFEISDSSLYCGGIEKRSTKAFVYQHV